MTKKNTISPNKSLLLCLIAFYCSVSSYANSPTNKLIFDDPSDCTLVVEVPEDFHVCFDEEFNLGGVINGDYDEFIWFENGSETNHDLNESLSISETTTFTLYAFNQNDENIIINGDFESGDSDFTSDYVIGTMSCFGLGFLDCEGTYGVIDDPSDGHGNFASCSDVVGGGNMMVVNGAASLQEIWCQDVCIEPGASYVFSAWAASVNPGSPAQLQFAIDGSLIGSLFSLTSTTCDWEEFEADWTADSETTIEICITNQNTAASGNDFALDGISFVRVCEDEASFTVTHSEFESEFNNPLEITCINNEVEVIINITPVADYTIEWNTNEGNIIDIVDDGKIILVNQAGEYFVTVTDAFGCSQEYDIEVEEDIEYPELDISSSNDLDCNFPTSELEVDADLNGIDFEWYNSDNELISDDNSIDISEGGYYYVLAFDDDTGCETLDSIFIPEDFETVPYEIQSSNDLDCHNLSASLSVSIPFESIEWSNIQNNEILGNFNTITIQQSGMYASEISFTNGCTLSDTIIIIETQPNFDFQIQYDSIINCSNPISNFILEIDTSIYHFSWIPGQNINTTSSIFEYTISDSGVYNFEILDSLGCSYNGDIALSADFAEPTFSITSDSIQCNDPIATISISNPNNLLDISWFPPNSTSINGDTLIMTSPGFVPYIVTAPNGCTSEDTVEVKSSESFPSLDIVSNVITCLEPIATLSTQSNINNLTYLWTLPDNSISTNDQLVSDQIGLYALTVETEDGCEASITYEVTQDTISPQIILPEDIILDCNNMIAEGVLNIPTNLSSVEALGNWLDLNDNSFSIQDAGDFVLTLTGENGCVAEKVLTISIDTITPIINFNNVQDLDCNSTGFLLEYSIDNNYETLIWNGINISPNDLAQDITSAGMYSLTAISANGCETTKGVTISSSDEAPEFTVTSTTIDCNNPESTVRIDILSDYEFINIYNNNSLVSNGLEYNTNQTDPLTIEVIGSNGCSTTEIINIPIDTTTIQFGLSADILTCDMPSTYIELNTNANYVSATIYDNATNYIGEINEDIFTPGNYVVVLENANGCTSSREIIIEQIGDFPEIQSYEISPLICETGMDLSNLIITGGQTPYELKINDVTQSNIDDSFVLTEIGTHIIEIIDSNGCSAEFDVEVTPVQQLDANILPEVTIHEGEEGQLYLTLNKTLSEIESIDWSPKRDLTCYDCLDPIFTGHEEISYLVKIKDIDGCEIEVRTKIIIETNVRYYIPNVMTIGTTNNNQFTIYDNGIDIVNIQVLNIYDRWGNLVFKNENFQPNDPSLGWDGRFNNSYVEPGVYVYYAKLELRNGEVVKESGDITFLK